MLLNSYDIFNDLMTLLEIDAEPSMWWVVRLFLLIVKGFEKNSLWSIIPPNLNSVVPSDTNQDKIISDYIGGLLFKNKPVSELFLSQKLGLDLVFKGNGGVISLPTSSGKTRIAEIAILQSLLKNQNSKILYVAPFRSLAFEIENTLNLSFSHLGYFISNLYGGNQFGAIDKALIQESNIIIATPEKSKALLRTGDEIISKIKLVILDEGHILSSQKRDVMNELFVEELKLYVNSNEGNILLLSAVLPNVEEIAMWITDSEKNNVLSDYRLSSQRSGILKFENKGINSEGNELKGVDLEWIGEIKSNNYNFIKSHERTKKSITKKRKIQKEKQINFPSDYKQAIAATAIKLLPIGSILIFVGISESVFTYAKEILFALGDNPDFHKYQNQKLWDEVIIACNEAYGDNSQILMYARYGIICHNANIIKEVKLLLERLLREENPKIILSTTTLAQGVNLGVSTVIFASVKTGKNNIPNRDYWNIAGRAGRAFIDTEGKILYAVDATIINKNNYKSKAIPYSEYKNKREWQIRSNYDLLENYFNKSKINIAESGLLKCLKWLKNVATQCDISFELLLELISENNFSKLKTISGDNYESVIIDFFDWIDDTIISLDVNNEENINWIETFFIKSLAYIQAKQLTDISQENVISILKARNQAIKAMIPNLNKRKMYATSGLPLSAIIQIDRQLDEIIVIVNNYINSDNSFENKLVFFQSINGIIIKLPSSSFKITNSIDTDSFNNILKLWLAGTPMKEILQDFNQEVVIELSEKYFSYTIPWVLNGLCKTLSFKEEYKDKATFIEELAILCQLGLPSMSAVKVYLSGIHSRESAKEISDYINVANMNFKEVLEFIEANEGMFSEFASPQTNKWIEIVLFNKAEKSSHKIERLKNFSFPDAVAVSPSDILMIKKYLDSYYFCNTDFSIKIKIEEEEMNETIKEIANKPEFYFEKEFDQWSMKCRSPFYQIENKYPPYPFKSIEPGIF